MTTKEVTVNLLSGLHARPASKFVQLSKSYKSQIEISHKGKSSDPKSIIGLLSLGINRGAVITVSAHGEDEIEAVSALCLYVQEEE